MIGESRRRLLAAARRWTLKTRFVLGQGRDAWRARAAARTPTLALDAVQRRLDLLLTAMYGRPIPITPAREPESTWLQRTWRRWRRDPAAAEATPSVDGAAIRLPRTLSAHDGADAALARYRLLAIEQAERLARGTAGAVPARDPIVRDLYLLREGAAVDARIASALPGLAATLAREREAALQRRPELRRLTRPEREVELLLRRALSSTDEVAQPESDPAASLAWATATAEAIRRSPGSYRGLPPALLWGTVTPARTDEATASLPRELPPPPAGLSPPSNSTGWSESGARNGEVGIADDQDGPSAARRLDPAAPSANANEQSPDGELPDPARTRWSELDDPRAFDGERGIVFGDDALQVLADDTTATAGLPRPIAYDEWDADAGAYIRHAALVRLSTCAPGDERWAAGMLHRHSALVRQVRQQFERLRARRTLLGRQRAGDELDLDACVRSIVDRRTGDPPDDRLYLDARPARRGVALSLLVDASGSTETGVAEHLRIIDLEKLALLLASEALDALGDRYSIHAFAGRSAQDVRLSVVKDFREASGPAVRARIAGLEPGGFTRLGAAVRHATRELARESAGHRLLLILSDGRPNDVDRYQGSYGVEDSRQAIMEARASGVYPFCLTVDGTASEYLPRIFGKPGHTILQRPEQLPTALLRAVRALLRRR